MLTMSNEMLLLYGESEAKTVFNRLDQIDPDFNEIVQKIAYDYFWAREGLSLRDKSFVTIIALVATEKAEQTRIHINGFLNVGGEVHELAALLQALDNIIGTHAVEKAFIALKEVVKAKGLTLSHENSKLTERDQVVAAFAAYVAKGDIDNIRNSIKSYLVSNLGNIEELRNILIHQVVYCGFPSVMNGFNELRKYLDAI